MPVEHKAIPLSEFARDFEALVERLVESRQAIVQLLTLVAGEHQTTLPAPAQSPPPADAGVGTDAAASSSPTAAPCPYELLRFPGWPDGPTVAQADGSLAEDADDSSGGFEAAQLSAEVTSGDLDIGGSGLSTDLSDNRADRRRLVSAILLAAGIAFLLIVLVNL